MKTVIAATWGFSEQPIREALLSAAADDEEHPQRDLLAIAIEAVEGVENDPAVTTVGHNGAPNAAGVVEQDGAVMAGSFPPAQHSESCELLCGAVLGLRGFSGAARAARLVAEESKHSVLVGTGAAAFANERDSKLKRPPPPRSSEAVPVTPKDVDSVHQKEGSLPHDTVGMVGVEIQESHDKTPVVKMVAVTSTSGMAGKEEGRVGDSAVFGSGIFCDPAVGAAVCTGDGDDIVKFPLAFAVVQAMKVHPGNPTAAARAGIEDCLRLTGNVKSREIGVVCIDHTGAVGGWSSDAWAKEFKIAVGELDPSSTSASATGAVSTKTVVGRQLGVQ